MEGNRTKSASKPHAQSRSVTKGQAYGTFDGSGHFGFVAQIGAFKVGGTSVALLSGAFNDSIAAAKNIGAPENLTIREILA